MQRFLKKTLCSNYDVMPELVGTLSTEVLRIEVNFGLPFYRILYGLDSLMLF